MTRPSLSPPCKGWREDLPIRHEAPNLKPDLGKQIPNHLDAIYLDIPRSLIFARGASSTITILTAIFYLFIMFKLFSISDSENLSLAIQIAILIGLGAWSITSGIRIDISPPRDEPIRFNRARQKIYAYNFKQIWWNPFGKWKVVPVSYDWSQVHAERWSLRVAFPSGGAIYKWGVMLSIVKPGTNKVIDRFPLTCMGTDQHAWAYVCTYMQQGPSALPEPGTPKDHNDILWCEFALRLAPKVNWPADMDLESRTAP